jgi:deoxyribonuclease V
MKGTIACVDVAYSDVAAAAACAVFDRWEAVTPIAVETRFWAGPPAEYEPGAFYKRELPLLVEILRSIDAPLGVVLIDGYVWLGANGEPGLGARLYNILEPQVPVIGIAKTSYRADTWSTSVWRGGSARALFVTAAGIDTSEAARLVLGMHGQHRLPTIVTFTDRAARMRLEAGS